MTTKKRITLEDVSRAAGVSLSTASMILSGRPDVSFSPDTVQNVRHTADALGYRTPVRRRIRPLSARKLVLIVSPNVGNAYYANMVQAIQQSAEQQPERKTAPKILFKFVPELLPQKHIALAHEHNESAVHGAQRSRHRHDRDAAGQKQQVQTDELPCMVPKQIEKPTRTLAGRGKAAAFPTHSALHQFFIPVITMPSTKYR